MTTSSLSPGWVKELLKAHLTEDEMKKVASLIHAETWASPSALQREWQRNHTERPYRFHLEIDMKI